MSGRILIVDDVPTNRIVLKVKLSAAHYETLQAPDAATALKLAREAAPDLILLDLMLPDMSGVDLCRKLRADPATRHIPVIMLTAHGDTALRIAALRAGADDFVVKPPDSTLLMARMRNLLRARETVEELRLRAATCSELGFSEAAEGFDAPAHVALVAASRATAAQWRRRLAPHMPDRFTVMQGEEALDDHPGARAPDLYLIAADLADSSPGLRLISELRARPASRNAAITVVLDQKSQETAAMALDLGANDLLCPNFHPEETALRLSAQISRKRQADALRASLKDGLRLAVTDPLTGLFNRRYGLPHLERIAERARATGRQFAVMVLDLDRFKAVNDTWGHAAGDTVLSAVAQRIACNLRAADLVARIGGEEFLIVLPDTALPTARRVAERLCRAVEATPIALPDGRGEITVTASIGLAIGASGEAVAEMHAGKAILERADQALLAAKAEGRNQVTVGDAA